MKSSEPHANQTQRTTNFFDLAVQQRGVSNEVLDPISRKVDFTEAEARVAATYGQGGRPARVSARWCA